MKFNVPSIGALNITQLITGTSIIEWKDAVEMHSWPVLFVEHLPPQKNSSVILTLKGEKWFLYNDEIDRVILFCFFLITGAIPSRLDQRKLK